MKHPTTPDPLKYGVMVAAISAALSVTGPAQAGPRWAPAIPQLVAQTAGIPWSALSEEERQHLGPHRKRWPTYSADEQHRLRTGVRRYMELSPEQRRKVQQKQRRFKEMSPAERQRLRDQYRREKRGY